MAKHVNAEERARQWGEVARAMLNELRIEFAPGVVGDFDGVAAIRALKMQRDDGKAALRQMKEATKVLGQGIGSVAPPDGFFALWNEAELAADQCIYSVPRLAPKARTA